MICQTCKRSRLTIGDFYTRNGRPRPNCRRCENAARTRRRREGPQRVLPFTPEMTHQEIGATLGISAARVQQIEANAIRKLANWAEMFR